MSTVLWILAIISTSYYVTILLQDSLTTLYPKVPTRVSYGYGFCLIIFAGSFPFAVVLITIEGTFSRSYICDRHILHISADEYK